MFMATFLEEKLSDGTSRFKDADDSKVVGLMKKIVDSSTDPTINRLVEFANKDKICNTFSWNSFIAGCL